MSKHLAVGLLVAALLAAELGSHQIDIANWLFDALPETVIGTGGIDHWKDGHEVHDNIQVIFRYPGGRTLVFSSLSACAWLTKPSTKAALSSSPTM